MRFGDYWRVLLSHIILFGFVYPDKRQNVPAWVMEELTRRLSVSRPNLQSDVCYGTLLSREQYLHDIERLEIPRRPRGARRPDDARADRDLDRAGQASKVSGSSVSAQWATSRSPGDVGDNPKHQVGSERLKV